MPDLLLELFSEEIPARMQAKAAADLARLVTEGLKAEALGFETVRQFATPRRLALHITGLPLAQPDIREEKRGPRADAPEKAVAGFLASAGLTRDQVEERAEVKGTFLYAIVEKRGQATAQVLADRIIPNVIGNFPWAKSMRWGNGDWRWVRPLQSLLCLLDGRVVPFAIAGIESAGIESGDRTRGHRFHASAEFAVSDFADYQAKLRDAHVILDPAARQAHIADQARGLAAQAGLTLVEDDGLLAENAGLTEWPVPLIGRFDDAFLAVPPEVLTATMKKNQKYFTLKDAAGKMANRFVCVANLDATDGGTAIVAGNERVLSARLSDARFFWDQDRKVRLETYAKKLSGIVFHEKLGSVGDKVARMAVLARYLAPFCKADPEKAARAANLAKADLVTGMVGEFPEVQGIIGGYYAREWDEGAEVANAIAEHYSPLGPTDACPTAPVSIAVALADKIDTLVGFFGIDEKPTGSKDPYALRRAALGIIRLITENELRFPLHMIALTAFIQIPWTRNDEFDWDWCHINNAPSFLRYSESTKKLRFETLGILDFFADRLKVQQREKGVPHDLIDAVFSLGGEDDLVRLLARVAALQEFLKAEDGANLLAGYRRAANILRIEEKKEGAAFAGAVEPALLRESQEKALYEKLNAARSEAAAAVAVEDFSSAMAALARLRGPVDAFFDHVTVNADDPDLRRNRLNLLNDMRAAVHTVADFSKIQG